MCRMCCRTLRHIAGYIKVRHEVLVATHFYHWTYDTCLIRIINIYSWNSGRLDLKILPSRVSLTSAELLRGSSICSNRSIICSRSRETKWWMNANQKPTAYLVYDIFWLRHIFAVDGATLILATHFILVCIFFVYLISLLIYFLCLSNFFTYLFSLFIFFLYLSDFFTYPFSLFIYFLYLSDFFTYLFF